MGRNTRDNGTLRRFSRDFHGSTLIDLGLLGMEDQMAASIQIGANLKQVVPFLGVTDMERSVRFYIDGLGFAMKHQWVPEG